MRRTTYIPALMAIALLAAPLYAAMWQPGRSSGGATQLDRRPDGGGHYAQPSGGGPYQRPSAGGPGYNARPEFRERPQSGAQPGFRERPGYASPGSGQPHFSRPPQTPHAEAPRPDGRLYGERGGPQPQYGSRAEFAARPQAGTPYPHPYAAPYATPYATPYAAQAPSSLRGAVPPPVPPRGQGPHNGDWLRHTMQLPPQEQQQRLEQDQNFRQLPPERQQELKNRLQRFNSMPPDERQRVLNRMEMIEHLPPEQQRQTHELFHQFRSMDPERKDMMRRTLRQMRTMPPYARDRFLNSPLTESHFSPQEMQMLRGFNAIGFVGPEQ